MSLHGIWSNAPGSRLHTMETTCQGRVAKLLAGRAPGPRATELRRFSVVRGTEGFGDG